ncbi:penicillin acylase family protein [Microbacterium pseudoresistens]|uniref:Penicillin amidase n=1 Tax=Microbacterium pseudoresistens TaxID=640634 RepID=A0A7Y9EU47_9MICO|nr:penicillin acylase family protein [Microbacterium pseudoresistens]NYD53998.1 penicillin amidase [Microbacterium pseudoresistens]
MTALAPAHPDPDAPRPHRIGRIIGRLAFGVVAGIVVLATAAAFFLVWTIQRSFPQTSGELELSGLDAQVTVQRDDRGVPTITADNTHDLFFAQGFVHAQDRFWEMDFRRHVTSGRVAELFGESQAGTDAFLRTLDWHGIAEQEVEAMDETTRAYYEAYADGVNAYLADHSGATASLEYAVLELTTPGYEPEPWTPADSVAWLKAMAWDLRGNVEAETERALLAQSVDPATIASVYPAYPFAENPVIVPTITPADQLPAAAAASGDGGGSGSLAVAPTTDDTDDHASASAEPSPTASAVTWTEADGVLGAVSALIGDLGEGIGSNSWVVSGDLTESGMPLLANDPHLGASLPSVWYQMQLRCSTVSEECPFDVGGFSFSGLPSIVIGHNADIAWGFTNLTTDVTDLYIEKIDGDAYWRDGALVPLETRSETIEVAGGDDIDLEIRSTVHGPIVSGLTADFTAIAGDPRLGSGDAVNDPAWIGAPDASVEALTGEYAVSLRWTALDPGTTATAIFAMNTAKDFTDFRAAASLFDVPAQNLVYADREGNIGYQTPGRLPTRGAGNGFAPQPGWSSAYDWTGFIPFDDLPVSYNPESGYIVTANNAIVSDDYAYFLSRDWDYGYRAGRIATLIEDAAADGPITAQDLRDIQFDQEFWIGKKLAAVVQKVAVTGDGPKAAVELLRSWDAQGTADSAAAAFANVLWSNLAQNVFANRADALPLSSQGRMFAVVGAMLADPDDPLWVNDEIGVAGMDEMLALSIEQAYDEIASLQGEDPAAWNWGSLHALTLTHQTLGTSGIAPIEMLFNRGPFAVGGGASVVDATGWVLGESYETTTVPSMRMVVDLSDWDASTWNHLTGASGHAFHAHYTDQTDAWVKGEQSPWAFSEEAVDAAAVDTLVLSPAG